MARVVYGRAALDDLIRLADFLRETDPAAAATTVDLIIDAVTVLQDHPLVGRPLECGVRELMISRGRSGYAALYSFEEERDAVLILGIRHQREAGHLP